MKHYLIKYGRHYLLSVDRKTDKHPSKLTLVEFKSGATWYQKENVDEIIKRYGGKLVEIDAPIQWN